MFSVNHIPERVWNEVVRQGNDLVCLKCNRGKRGSQGLGDNYMTCDGCYKVKRRALFDQEMDKKWRTLDDSEEILCKLCTGEISGKGRQAQSDEKFPCCGVLCSSENGRKYFGRMKGRELKDEQSEFQRTLNRNES